MKDNELSLFFYTDDINTSRHRTNGKVQWTIDENDNTLDKSQHLFDYYSKYCSKSKLVIELASTSNIDSKICVYDKNLKSQLSKFMNVLELAKKSLTTKDNNNINTENAINTANTKNTANSTTDKYDIIIRLRPDIFFTLDITTEFLKTVKNSNRFIQNSEIANRYNGDVIQIFDGIYLDKIIENCKQYLNNDKAMPGIYEDCINKIATLSNLKIEHMPNLCGRWYDCYATYYPNLCWIYFNDWKNIEYKYHFNYDLVKQITHDKSLQSKINKTYLDDKNNNDAQNNLKFQLTDNHVQLYCAAMRFDYIENMDILANEKSDVQLKLKVACEISFAGIIPCAGTATRMGGLPKFLLPCGNGTLLNNTISHYRKHFIDKIYLGFSEKNMQYYDLLDNSNCDLRSIDVKNTNTMSETVIKMTENINTAKNYILFMPDTFFRLDNELVNMMKMLSHDNYDLVVIVWKIRPEQYGKLGQCLIENGNVVDIKDKDPMCRYEYSWGVIGWNRSMTKYIDPLTPHVGFLINTALENNKKVGAVISNSIYYDCGTYNEYFQMVKNET